MARIIPANAGERLVSYRMAVERFVRSDMEVTTRLGKETVVDIILPVTESLQDLERMMEQISRTNVGYQMVFLNDGIQNELVRDFLKEYAEKEPQTKIVENQIPIGIVSSVNRGLVITRSEYVVLLSEQLTLPENWLERLIMPLVKDPTVASVTPFSNIHPVTGFPHPGKGSLLFEDESVSHLDQLFQRIRSVYTSIPFGGSFCKAMSRDVIHKIGVLDQQSYRSLERADLEWSKKASLAGYRHVVAENLYAGRKTGADQRKGGEKDDIPEGALTSWNKADPLAEVRAYVFGRLISERAKRIRLIFHQKGNPSADLSIGRYILEKIGENEAVLNVEYDKDNGIYVLKMIYGDHQVPFAMNSIDEIMDLAKDMSVRRIMLGRMMGFPTIHDLLSGIRILAEQLGVRLVITLMDFFPICPNGSLFSPKKGICHFESNACENCRIGNTEAENSGFTDIFLWRQMWKEFLLSAQEIQYFSSWQLKTMEQVFGRLEKVHQIEAPEMEVEPVSVKQYHEGTRILIQGVMNPEGGRDFVKGVIRMAEKKKLPVLFFIVGSGAKGRTKAISSRLVVRTQNADVKTEEFIKENEIDILLLPETAPDPIGMRAKTAVKMDIPAACRQNGASAEQMKWYAKGMVLSEEADKDPEQALKELMDFSAKLKEREKENAKKRRSVRKG